eukprot:sb/3473633/
MALEVSHPVNLHNTNLPCYSTSTMEKRKFALETILLVVVIPLQMLLGNTTNLKPNQKLSRCSVYDPVLGQTERQLIEEQGLIAPGKGDGCRKKATVPTLFYMIHCSKDMYDSVITANKGTLGNCVIIGNSIQGYLTHNTDASLRNEVG